MYVYYDEPKIASVIGAEKAREFLSLSSFDLGAVSLTVSVKDGSMIPKDAMSRHNQAIELWSAGAMDPISLFEALDYPNPRDSAKSLYLWQTNPSALFPELMQPAPVTGAPPQTGQPTPNAGQAASGTPPPGPPPSQNLSTALPLNPLPK